MNICVFGTSSIQLPFYETGPVARQYCNLMTHFLARSLVSSFIAVQCCKIKLISFLSCLSKFIPLANVHPKHCCVYSGPYYWLGCCDERGVLLNGSYLSWHSPSVPSIPKMQAGQCYELGTYWILKGKVTESSSDGNENNSMLLKSRVFLSHHRQNSETRHRVQESKVGGRIKLQYALNRRDSGEQCPEFSLGSWLYWV